jgi:chromosome segregation ATPase
MDRETSEEIKRHFNVVAEGLRSEMRAVAEGVGANTDRLDRVDERLDRLESRMEEGFGEIKAMIRLSFGELDRRIRSLESDVTSLRARLEKLESQLGT